MALRLPDAPSTSLFGSTLGCLHFFGQNRSRGCGARSEAAGAGVRGCRYGGAGRLVAFGRVRRPSSPGPPRAASSSPGLPQPDALRRGARGRREATRCGELRSGGVPERIRRQPRERRASGLRIGPGRPKGGIRTVCCRPPGVWTGCRARPGAAHPRGAAGSREPGESIGSRGAAGWSDGAPPDRAGRPDRDLPMREGRRPYPRPGPGTRVRHPGRVLLPRVRGRQPWGH